MKILKLNVYHLITVLLLFITFILNFSWNLSDHDDGHTIGFHLLGRNPDLQRAYAPYDSMCDFLLGFLPANYYIIFAAMVITTFISSILIIFLLEKICIDFIGEKYIKGLVPLIFIIAMPEYLYMIFTFKSSMIGFVFILLSHYLLINKTSFEKSLPLKILLTALLFGVGVSFRWSLIIYGLIIWGDYLYKCIENNTKLTRSLITSFIWGVSALFFCWIFVTLSGYSLQEFGEVMIWGNTYLKNVDFQSIAQLTNVLTFLTPLSSLFLLLGMSMVLLYPKSNKRIIILILTAWLPIVFMGFASYFKYYISLLPLIFLLFNQSIIFLNDKVRLNKTLKIVMLTILGFGPWLIGVQISTANSNWGPNFDIKLKPSASKIDTASRLDDRFKLDAISIKLTSGCAIPTPEGVRPLYGHAYALYGGDLKRIDEKLNQEALDLIEVASEGKYTVFIDEINPYFLMALSRTNFKPDRIWKQPGFTNFRYYTHNSDSIGELRIRPNKLKFSEQMVYDIIKGQKIIAYFSFSSRLTKLLALVDSKEGSVTNRIGPFTAIIDLRNVKE